MRGPSHHTRLIALALGPLITLTALVGPSSQSAVTQPPLAWGLSTAGTGPPAPRTYQAALSPVHRAGRWLVDGAGRVVVLHGFNIVHKTAPFYPDRFGLQDAKFLKSEGFNVARIGLAWAAIEPRPGVYDDGYLAKFLRFQRLLGRYGIRALVDVHQDLWSSENMPAWASLGTAYADNFQAFWDNQPAADGVGIQTHFIRMWQHVATALKGDPNVLGLDPFNEPQPGLRSACGPFLPCPQFEQAELSRFYQRFVAGVRKVDSGRLVLLEPLPTNNLIAPGVQLPGDRNVGVTFHQYCNITQLATSSGPQDAACDPLERQGLDTQVGWARESEGVPTFVGEWSSGDANDDNAHMADLMAQEFLSWTIWQYYTYAQDPANTPGQGILIDDQKPGSEANAKQGKLDAIAIPYARAIAGSPRTTGYDRTTRRFTLIYGTSAVAGAHLTTRTTTIFLPRMAFPNGFRIRVRHGSFDVVGRVLKVRSASGASWVSVVVTPRSASYGPRRTPAALDTGPHPPGWSTASRLRGVKHRAPPLSRPPAMSMGPL